MSNFICIIVATSKIKQFFIIMLQNRFDVIFLKKPLKFCCTVYSSKLVNLDAKDMDHFTFNLMPKSNNLTPAS